MTEIMRVNEVILCNTAWFFSFSQDGFLSYARYYPPTVSQAHAPVRVSRQVPAAIKLQFLTTEKRSFLSQHGSSDVSLLHTLQTAVKLLIC